MKPIMPALAVLAAMTPMPAAAAVIYNLTLTPGTGSTIGGTGTITLDYAPAATGLTSYAVGTYSNLSFTIGGQTFTAAAGSNNSVQFQDGQVRNITFSQQVGTSPNRLSLQTSGVYAFYYDNLQSVSRGTLSSSPAMAAVPEPATWTMMIGGFALVGAMARRRRAIVGAFRTA